MLFRRCGVLLFFGWQCTAGVFFFYDPLTSSIRGVVVCFQWLGTESAAQVLQSDFSDSPGDLLEMRLRLAEFGVLAGPPSGTRNVRTGHREKLCATIAKLIEVERNREASLEPVMASGKCSSGEE